MYKTASGFNQSKFKSSSRKGNIYTTPEQIEIRRKRIERRRRRKIKEKEALLIKLSGMGIIVKPRAGRVAELNRLDEVVEARKNAPRIKLRKGEDYGDHA